MDVSNLLGQLIVNQGPARPGFAIAQVYVPALLPFSNGDGPSVTLIVPQLEEPKSETDSEEEDCEDASNDPDCYYTSSEEKIEDGDGEGAKKRKKKRARCIHRTRYSREEYRCDSCPYTCTTEKAFLRHVRKCESKDCQIQSYPLSCPVCGKDRRNELTLSTHMVKHKSGKHFCCDLCKFKSIQLKKIIQHRRMHTGEKPHLCPHCSYRSSRRDNLRSHVRRMHNEDDLHCDTFTPRKILLIPNTQN